MVNSCRVCIVWNMNRSSSLDKSDRESYVVSCNQFKLWRVDKSYHVEVKGGELRLDNFLSLKLHKDVNKQLWCECMYCVRCQVFTWQDGTRVDWWNGQKISCSERVASHDDHHSHHNHHHHHHHNVVMMPNHHHQMRIIITNAIIIMLNWSPH